MVASCSVGNGEASSIDPLAIPRATIQIPTTTPQSIDTIQLGRMKEGESITSYFAVDNNSQKSIVIENIFVTCTCTQTTLDKRPIVTGESRVVEFTFNSAGRPGEQIKSIELQISGSERVKVVYRAEVEPKY